MHIGLIGGIGPTATVAYYTGLVTAFRDAGMDLNLTMSHADISVLADNAASDRADAQAQVFATHLAHLRDAGCDMGVITALTGHFCIEQTARLSPIPVLNAIDLIDDHCACNGIGVLGLLGGPSVMETHLFGQLKKVRSVVPETDRDWLGDAYMRMAMTGKTDAATADRFISAGAEMVRDQGADAVLLAGTDLGLVFDGRSVGYATVDALDVHIRGLLSLASQHGTGSVQPEV